MLLNLVTVYVINMYLFKFDRAHEDATEFLLKKI